MRATFLAAAAAACVFAISSALGQTPTPLQDVTASIQQLPQAQPGAKYIVQLSIPAGVVGYPFKVCHVLGKLPDGFQWNATTFQLRTAATVPEGTDGLYRLTLEIEDVAGNKLSLPLVLNISSQPIALALSVTAEQGPPAVVAGAVDKDKANPDLLPAHAPAAPANPAAPLGTPGKVVKAPRVQLMCRTRLR